jgi:hypothetical protein
VQIVAVPRKKCLRVSHFLQARTPADRAVSLTLGYEF